MFVAKKDITLFLETFRNEKWLFPYNLAQLFTESNSFLSPDIMGNYY
jgi:hypothetical protein